MLPEQTVTTKALIREMDPAELRELYITLDDTNDPSNVFRKLCARCYDELTDNDINYQ